MRKFLILLVCLSAGCSIPDPTGPLPVRPEDLARCYRDTPTVAGTAYDNQLVMVDLTWGRRSGELIVWSLGVAPTSIPVILCEFDGPCPANTKSLRIVGRCRGRFDDYQAREISGYSFTIRITECRPAPGQPAQ